MNKKLLMFIPIIAAVASIGSIALLDSNQPIVGEMSSVIIPYSIEDASDVADYVIIGTVEKMTPVRVDMPKESDEDRVYTDIVLNVNEDILGTYHEKQISVRILGGEADNAKLVAHQSGDFSIGKEVLLFISGNDSYTYSNENFILAQHYGVYDIVEETAKNQGTGLVMTTSSLTSQIQLASSLR